MVLEKNKSERHIRGGMATKQKYETEDHPHGDPPFLLRKSP